jgi:hypothetical protein
LVMFGGVVAMSTYHTNDESKKKFLQRWLIYLIAIHYKI